MHRKSVVDAATIAAAHDAPCEFQRLATALARAASVGFKSAKSELLPGWKSAVSAWTAAWYPKTIRTFRDAIAAVRHEIWARQISFMSRQRGDRVELLQHIWERKHNAPAYARLDRLNSILGLSQAEARPPRILARPFCLAKFRHW